LERAVTTGPLEALRATRKLALNTTACPVWCDHQHDRTGDDGGINHGCAVSIPAVRCRLDAYLRAEERSDHPGELGPVLLGVFTTQPDPVAARDWYIEMEVDAQTLEELRAVVRNAMRLLGAALQEADSSRLNCELERTIGNALGRPSPSRYAGARS